MSFRTAPVFKTDYQQLYKKNTSFASIKFLQECCIKLEVRPSTFAHAATVFHRVVSNLHKFDYDKFSIATGCIYLSCKVNEDPIRLKNIINVSQVTLNREEALEQLGNEAWIVSMRDSIVQCELFIMRVLHFDPAVHLPHPFLFNYINTAQNWLDDDTTSQTPIATCALSVLHDFYCNPAIIKFKPEHIAIACLALTFQIYGLTLSAVDDADSWHKMFCPDLEPEELWEMIDQILRVYETERS